jgi:hypothetical protein
MDKRVYSLNLATYIIMETGIEPTLDIDYSNGNGLVHCVFPECEGVLAAIKAYKNDKHLHSYLQTYGELRDSIKAARGV